MKRIRNITIWKVSCHFIRNIPEIWNIYAVHLKKLNLLTIPGLILSQLSIYFLLWCPISTNPVKSHLSTCHWYFCSLPWQVSLYFSNPLNTNWWQTQENWFLKAVSAKCIIRASSGQSFFHATFASSFSVNIHWMKAVTDPESQVSVWFHCFTWTAGSACDSSTACTCQSFSLGE